LGVLAVVLGFAALAGWKRLPPNGGAPAAVVRFEVQPPDSDGRLQRADVSPDGRRILLEERTGDGAVRLYVRDLDQLTSTPVPITDPSPRWALFSPDGSELAFVSASSRNGFEGKLRVAPVRGGDVRTLADGAVAKPGWGDDGYIYYSAFDPHSGLARILRIPASGGSPDTVVKSDSVSFYVPTPLPGARALLVIINNRDRTSVGVADLRARTWRSLAPSGYWVAYTRGYVLFDRRNALMAAPFDPETLRLTGDAVQLMEVSTPEFGAFHVGGGTLAYLAGIQGSEVVPVLVDRAGRRRRLDGLAPRQVYGEPTVSPDGRTIAFESAPVIGERPATDLWVYRLPRGPLNRLTFGGRNENAIWTLDGRRLLFDSDRGGEAAIWWMPWDGSSQPERVLQGARSWGFKNWLPDGKRFALTIDSDTAGGFDIALASVGRPRGTDLVVSGPANQHHPSVSPDGRWLAYQSDESGQNEIYLRSLTGDGVKRQVSTHGGQEPMWSRGGGQLYFESLAGDSLCALRLDRAGNSVGPVQSLFAIRLSGHGFDVLPGDSLFVVIDPAGAGAERAQPLVVVSGFPAELDIRMASSRRQR
jgi:serine/threonine-protein kinase